MKSTLNMTFWRSLDPAFIHVLVYALKVGCPINLSVEINICVDPSDSFLYDLAQSTMRFFIVVVIIIIY